MNTIQKSLIKEARKRFKVIYPVSIKKSLEECFTEEENQTIFWFNVKGGSTHVLYAPNNQSNLSKGDLDVRNN